MVGTVALGVSLLLAMAALLTVPGHVSVLLAIAICDLFVGASSPPRAELLQEHLEVGMLAKVIPVEPQICLLEGYVLARGLLFQETGLLVVNRDLYLHQEAVRLGKLGVLGILEPLPARREIVRGAHPRADEAACACAIGMHAGQPLAVPVEVLGRADLTEGVGHGLLSS